MTCQMKGLLVSLHMFLALYAHPDSAELYGHIRSPCIYHLEVSAWVSLGGDVSDPQVGEKNGCFCLKWTSVHTRG